MAVVPKVIKNFHLIVDGFGFAGVVEEVKLPDLKIKHEEHRAGGMDAPMAIDMGMDRMELGFTMAEHHPYIFKQFGLQSQNAVQVTFRAAQVDDVQAIPYIINARGMYIEQRLGSVKNGTIAKLEATISLRYFRLAIGGKDLWEFDVDNMVRKVNGVDQLEVVRAALGL